MQVRGIGKLRYRPKNPDTPYLAELRLQFKPKRNFIKLLDGVARSTI